MRKQIGSQHTFIVLCHPFSIVSLCDFNGQKFVQLKMPPVLEERDQGTSSFIWHLPRVHDTLNN